MTPSYDVIAENAAFRLRELIDYWRKATRAEVRAATAHAISGQYRMLAIANLLGELETDSFFLNLRNAAHSWRAVLEPVEWAKVTDRYYLCASRIRGFWDAAASRDFELAAELARLAPRQASAVDEDPDDFAFARWAMDVAIAKSMREPQVEESTLQLEKAVRSSDPRLALAKALAKGDPAKFDEALTAFIDSHGKFLEDSRDGQNPEFAETELKVDVEALALVELARRYGLSTRPSYPKVPAVVLSAEPPEGPEEGDWASGG